MSDIKGTPSIIWLNISDEQVGDFDFDRLTWRDLEEVTWTADEPALSVAVKYRLASDYDAVAAELEKSVNNARANWIDAEQQAARVRELEADLLHPPRRYDGGLCGHVSIQR